jgi:hypothetical protein
LRDLVLKHYLHDNLFNGIFPILEELQVTLHPAFQRRRFSNCLALRGLSGDLFHPHRRTRSDQTGREYFFGDSYTRTYVRRRTMTPSVGTSSELYRDPGLGPGWFVHYKAWCVSLA